ncbi:MAG: TetR/AcrR family transcriptional regulator [Myxococcales bacterium]|nr:TetR/AcrR family transcriptional regulator [Myxococcales bacterium]
MARPIPADRFAQLLDAALEVFADRGVHRARMADVARVLGMSTGTLYNYVESKDALFYLLLQHALQEAPPQLPESLPIQTPERDVLLATLDEKVRFYSRFEGLERAIAQAEVADPRGEFVDIVTTLYDRISSKRKWLDVLERSSEDSPEVAHLFLVRVKQATCDALAAWLGQRMATGQLRAVTTPEMAARFVMETLTTFGRRLPRDPNPERNPLPAEEMGDAVVKLLVSTFVAHPSS